MNSVPNNRLSAIDLLRSARVSVAAQEFILLSLPHEDFTHLLQNSELSPRGSAPFMILSDKYEVTLMLDETDFSALGGAVASAKVERGFRLATFDIELDLTVTGFLAEVTRILAEIQVPVLVVSAFARDHLLIKQQDLGSALKELGKYVAELC